jgi:hypothetical protein
MILGHHRIYSLLGFHSTSSEDFSLSPKVGTTFRSKVSVCQEMIKTLFDRSETMDLILPELPFGMMSHRHSAGDLYGAVDYLEFGAAG